MDVIAFQTYQVASFETSSKSSSLLGTTISPTGSLESMNGNPFSQFNPFSTNQGISFESSAFREWGHLPVALQRSTTTETEPSTHLQIWQSLYPADTCVRSDICDRTTGNRENACELPNADNGFISYIQSNLPEEELCYEESMGVAAHVSLTAPYAFNSCSGNISAEDQLTLCANGNVNNLLTAPFLAMWEIHFDVNEKTIRFKSNAKPKGTGQTTPIAGIVVENIGTTSSPKYVLKVQKVDYVTDLAQFKVYFEIPPSS